MIVLKWGWEFFVCRMNKEKKLNNDKKSGTLKASQKLKRINARAVDFAVKLLSKYVWLFIFYFLLSFKLFFCQ